MCRDESVENSGTDGVAIELNVKNHIFFLGKFYLETIQKMGSLVLLRAMLHITLKKNTEYFFFYRKRQRLAALPISNL